MTIPRERFRAIRWAREWLEEVSTDPKRPASERAETTRLLASYPTDLQLRELIDRKAVGLPTEIARPLIGAVSWIFAFEHAVSDPWSLARVRRHLPSPGEIHGELRDVEPEGLGVQVRNAIGVHCWLEPDEDYVDAVIIGWIADCAVAVAAKSTEGRDADTLDNVWPQYLITASTSGVRHDEVTRLQSVLCTVPRSRTPDAQERCFHVRHCEVQILGTSSGTSSSEGASDIAPDEAGKCL